VPRWLLTCAVRADERFDRVLQINHGQDIDWPRAWLALAGFGIENLCVLGGSEAATAL
jgi:hypothetical protein